MGGEHGEDGVTGEPVLRPPDHWRDVGGDRRVGEANLHSILSVVDHERNGAGQANQELMARPMGMLSANPRGGDPKHREESDRHERQVGCKLDRREASPHVVGPGHPDEASAANQVTRLAADDRRFWRSVATSVGISLDPRGIAVDDRVRGTSFVTTAPAPTIAFKPDGETGQDRGIRPDRGAVPDDGPGELRAVLLLRGNRSLVNVALGPTKTSFQVESHPTAGRRT